MSRNEPTDGAWKWHWRFEDGQATGSIYSEPRAGHAYAVAMCPRYQSEAQWKVDAPLLAGAKDLLEALELLQGFDFRLDDSEHGKEIRRRALAAIAMVRP